MFLWACACIDKVQRKKKPARGRLIYIEIQAQASLLNDACSAFDINNWKPSAET